MTSSRSIAVPLPDAVRSMAWIAGLQSAHDLKNKKEATRSFRRSLKTQRLLLIASLCLPGVLTMLACSFLSSLPFLPQATPTSHVPSPIVPILMERSALSGVWTGTETLTAVGSCKFEQGDSVTNPVKMLWRVNDEGDVTVTLPDWPGVYSYTFKGEIQPDLSISLELSTSAMCSGNESPYSSTFEGGIVAVGETLALDVEATEVWCPGTCVFTRRFSIQKTGESP